MAAISDVFKADNFIVLGRLYDESEDAGSDLLLIRLDQPIVSLAEAIKTWDGLESI